MIILSLFDGCGMAYQALKNLGVKVDKYYASEIDKYAIQIAKKNHPDIVELGDINRWKEWEIERPDLIIGGFPCIPAGTKIKTKYGYKNIEDVTSDDYVLTHNNQYKKVVETMSKTSNHINTIKSQGAYNIKLTDEHPLYIYRGGDFIWVNANEVENGDYITYNINQKSQNIYNLTETECWILGRFLADGVADKNKKMSYFCIGQKKVNIFEEVVSEYDYFICHPDRTCNEYYIKDYRIYELSLAFGHSAKEKHIPDFIIDLPKNLLLKFWEGYISGDGHYDTKVNRYMFCTTSEKMLLGLQDIIIKLYGKIPSCSIRIDKRKKSFSDTYNGQFYKTQKDSFVKDDKLCVRVKDVIREETIITVYNLEVEDDNSYTINNVIVHNCQSFSIAGNRLNFDDERGKLFFIANEILKHYKPKHFLLENVSGMRKDIQKIINDILGCEPICINSSLVSAQNRKRLYWTNIKGITQPEDKNILLKDILENEVDEKYFVSNKAKIYITNIERLKKKHTQIGGEKSLTLTAKGNNNWTGTFVGVIRLGHLNSGGQGDRIYDTEGKSVTLSANGGGRRAKTGLYMVSCGAIRGRYNREGKTEQQLELRKDEKSNALTTVQKDNVIIDSALIPMEDKTIYSMDREYDKCEPNKEQTPTITSNSWEQNNFLIDSMKIRKLTPIECERLQTLPDRYTEGVSDSQRYKMLGNGFTVRVIEHILNEI